MGEASFADFTQQALALSYEQTLILMAKLVENLQHKSPQQDNYQQLENAVVKNNMQAMWEELKDDTW